MKTKIEAVPLDLKTRINNAVLTAIGEAPEWGVCQKERLSFVIPRELNPAEKMKIEDILGELGVPFVATITEINP